MGAYSETECGACSFKCSGAQEDCSAYRKLEGAQMGVGTVGDCWWQAIH